MTDFAEAGPEKWLESYSSAYGRMCVLACQALYEGCGRHYVELALAGKGGSMYTPFTRQTDGIRRQRRHIVTLLKQASVCGVAQAAIVQVAREAREVIGAEWYESIPVPSEA